MRSAAGLNSRATLVGFSTAVEGKTDPQAGRPSFRVQVVPAKQQFN